MNQRLTVLMGSLWLLVIVIGSGVLLAHDYSAGKDAGVAAVWPSRSRIPHAPGQPTLLMFAHPKCPCTRASLRELERVLAQSPGCAQAFVVFLRPQGKSADWSRTDLWRRAQSIPGVTVLSDEQGREAEAFQTTTSGHVLFYNARQRLQFSGGITASRGHEGDSMGRSALLAILEHGVRAVHTAPVFGCSLQDSEPAAEPKP